MIRTPTYCKDSITVLPTQGHQNSGFVVKQLKSRWALQVVLEYCMTNPEFWFSKKNCTRSVTKLESSRITKISSLPAKQRFLKGTVLMYRSISTGYRSIPALMLEICYVYGYIFTRPCAALLGKNHAPKSSKCVQKNRTLELLESRVTLDQKIA